MSGSLNFPASSCGAVNEFNAKGIVAQSKYLRLCPGPASVFWCTRLCRIHQIMTRRHIYLAIKDTSKKCSMPLQNWWLAMSRFIIELVTA